MHIRRSLSPWNIVFLLAGVASLLFDATRFRHVSGPGCGVLLAGRYTIPYATMLVGLLVIGLGSIVTALRIDESKVRDLFVKLALIGFGLLFGLIAAEGMLRIIDPLPSIEDSSMANHDILGKVHASNRTLQVADDRGLEWSRSVQTDDLGLIIRDDNPNRPDPNATRVLMIGDSFVEGMAVPVMDNMSEVLERSLSAQRGEPYQVTNTGVNSYNPTNYLLSYRVYKDQFEPQIVVVIVYVGNDFMNIRDNLSNRIVMDANGDPIHVKPLFDYTTNSAWSEVFDRYVPLEVRESRSRRGSAALETAKVAVIYPLCQSLQKQSPTESNELSPDEQCADLSGKLTLPCDNYAVRNESLIRNNKAAVFKDALLPMDQEDIGQALHPLALLQQEVNADGRTLLIVIMPRKAQVPDQPGSSQLIGVPDGESIQNTGPQDIILNFCTQNDLTCLDLLPTFRAHSDEQLYWLYDSHLTAAGHQLTGETIAAELLTMP